MFENMEKELLDDLGEQCYDHKKEDSCVTINIVTKCDKKKPWKKDDKCVNINIFTECD